MQAGSRYKGCGAHKRPDPLLVASLQSLVEEEHTPKFRRAGITLDAPAFSRVPSRPVGRDYGIDSLLLRRGYEPPDTIDLLIIDGGYRHSLLLGGNLGVETDQIHADPGEKPGMQRHVARRLLIDVGPDRPEPQRSAIAEGKPAAIAREPDEAGLPSDLFIEIPQIEYWRCR